MTKGTGLIGLSEDFPKLVKTLAQTEKEFDFWNDLVEKLYENSKKGNYESYFKKIIWVHLDKQYPSCPDLENDWEFLEGRYVNNTEGTKYRVKHKQMLESPLKKYIKNESIPILAEI